jgi:hypothetical protein
MSSMWVSLNQDLIDMEQDQRQKEIATIYKQRRALELAGYVPLGTRVRARFAGLLLRLAVRLDGAVDNGQWAIGNGAFNDHVQMTQRRS